MNLSTYLVAFTEVESQSYLHTIDKGLDVTTLFSSPHLLHAAMDLPSTFPALTHTFVHP